MSETPENNNTTPEPVAPESAAPAPEAAQPPAAPQAATPAAPVSTPAAPAAPAPAASATGPTEPIAPLQSTLPQPPAPINTAPASQSYAPPAPLNNVAHAAPAVPAFSQPTPPAFTNQAPPAFGGQPPAAPTAPATDAKATAQGSSFRRTSTVTLVAALAVAALVGGVSGAGVVMLTNANNTSNSPASATVDPTSITINDPANATTITAVAAKAAASVVTISVAAGEEGGTGSGVVLSKDGYILTNTHVVTLDGASSDGTIQVQLNDGRLFSAKLIGTDPISDLAVIKVEGVTDLQPAEFADSSKLNVGDSAIAIGAPLGLSGTVTDGIVSALNRSITIASSAVPDDTEQEDTQDQSESPFELWGFDLPGQDSTATSSTPTISLSVVQTDAAINPGNSGGALLNSQGEVIGINVAIASAGGSSASSQSGSIGVGFAIPANLAERVSKEIIANGSATHGLLGASVGDVSTDDASATVGAVIKEVVAGGAAEEAGLKAGDVVTTFNGLPITGMTDITAQVRALAAGADATLTYVRDGKASSVDVTLGTLEQ